LPENVAPSVSDSARYPTTRNRGIEISDVTEQDHRDVKPRIGPMFGFKWFRTAAFTISGIVLLRRIHKCQFNLSGLRLKDRSTPAVWNAVLAA
jgi:transposase-like protein